MKNKIWNGGFEYLNSCIAESGATAIMIVTADGASGDAQAFKLLENLGKCGATIKKDGTKLSAFVTKDIAEKLLASDRGAF